MSTKPKDITTVPGSQPRNETFNLANVKQQIQGYTNAQHMLVSNNTQKLSSNSATATIVGKQSSRQSNTTKSVDRSSHLRESGQAIRPSSTGRNGRSSTQPQPSSALSAHRKSKTINNSTKESSRQSQQKSSSVGPKASSKSRGDYPTSGGESLTSTNKIQNLTQLMNNLNMLTQKTTFDSVASQHMRTSQAPGDVRKSFQHTQPISSLSTGTHKEKESRNAAQPIPSSRINPTVEGRYPITSQLVMDKEYLARTLDPDANNTQQL